MADQVSDTPNDPTNSGDNPPAGGFAPRQDVANVNGDAFSLPGIFFPNIVQSVMLGAPVAAAMAANIAYRNRDFIQLGLDVARSPSARDRLAGNSERLLGGLDPISKLRLLKALDLLSQTPEGKLLVQELEQSDARMKFSTDPRDSGGMFRPTMHYGPNGALESRPDEVIAPGSTSQGRLIAVLAHELEHLHQAQSQAITPLSQGKIISPRDTILYNRFTEADAQATATEIAWRLKQQGHPETWNSLKSPRQASFETAIADAFEKAVTADPAALDNGYAKRAAFDAWFEANYTPDVKIRDDYVDIGLSKFPGVNTFDALTKKGAVVGELGAEDYRRLGQQVSGVNYLDLPGSRPLNDPYYSQANMTPEQTQMLANQEEIFERLKNRPGTVVLAGNDPGLRPAPRVLPKTVEDIPPQAIANNPYQQAADLFIRGMKTARMTAENIRIAMDTPSALVSAIPFVQQRRINRAMDDLSSIPEGKELVDAAKAGNVPVKLTPHPLDRGGNLRMMQGVEGDRVVLTDPSIKLQGFSTDGQVVLQMAHELQHLRQLNAGLRSAFQGQLRTPWDATMNDRFLEADAEATATELAYKLKQAGKPAAWEAIRNNLAMTPELADAYESAIEKDPAAATDGRAKRAAFDAWFTARFQGTGERVTKYYGDEAMRNYPLPQQIESMQAAGAKHAPLTPEELKRLGSLSDVNYLAIPGGRPLDDGYYALPPVSRWANKTGTRLTEQFDDIIVPKVTMQHGTSEANLASILDNGFQPRYQGAREKVRNVVQGALPEGSDIEAGVDKVMGTITVNRRAHEIGDLLYTTSDADRAKGYAVREAPSGGELTSRIYSTLGLGERARPYADARPVLLELAAPRSDIVPFGGEEFRQLPDGRTTVDSTHEVLLRADEDIQVKSVTFAKIVNGQWTFEGQPKLTPEEARAQIQPKYASARPAPPADPGKREILKELGAFETGPGAELVENGTAYSARISVTNENGGKEFVHVPDTTFVPMAEDKLRFFDGVVSKYKMPYDLTPIEMNAYTTMLDVKEQRGDLTAEQKAQKLSALYDEMERVNPQLKDVPFDRANPAKVSEAVRGVVNDIAPADIAFHLSDAPRPAGYESSRGPAAGLDWNFAPETIQRINTQLAQMNEDFAQGNAPVSEAPVTGTAYDRLPDTTRKIAAQWREKPVTDMPWKPVEDLKAAGLPDISNEGHTRPFWVQSEFEGKTVYAVAKPLDHSRYLQSAEMKAQSTGNETPIHDKIAFDVAYDAGVPVAPAALWQDDAGKKYVLSLKPFDHVETLRDIRLSRGAEAGDMALIDHLPEVSSASTFNIFAAQSDDHGGNIMFDANNPKAPPVFIDYDMALQTEVANNGRPRVKGLADYFHEPEREWNNSDQVLRAVDTDAANATATRLKGLDEAHLKGLVDRIPDDFLSPSQKQGVTAYFEGAAQSFDARFNDRFGGGSADPRLPDVVTTTTRERLPADLAAVAFPATMDSDRLINTHPAASMPVTEVKTLPANGLDDYFLVHSYRKGTDPFRSIMDLPPEQAIALMQKNDGFRGTGEADANGNRDQAQYHADRAATDAWLRANTTAARDRENPIYFSLTKDPAFFQSMIASDADHDLMVVPLRNLDPKKWSGTFDDSMGNMFTQRGEAAKTTNFLSDSHPLHGTVMDMDGIGAAVQKYGTNLPDGKPREIEMQYWGQKFDPEALGGLTVTGGTAITPPIAEARVSAPLLSREAPAAAAPVNGADDASPGLAARVQKMLSSGWHQAKVNVLAQFPVIGPHGTDEDQAELLLSGKKPLGWMAVVPDNVDIYDPDMQRRIAVEAKLDDAVKAGRLISTDITTPERVANGTYLNSVMRVYAQPGNERDLANVANYNRQLWSGQEPDVQLDKTWGDYLGYRQRDQMLFDLVMPKLPRSIADAVYDFNSRYTQPAYLETQLGHPVPPSLSPAWQLQQGDPRTKVQLGAKYEYGMDGTPKDPAKAFALYTSAAEQGLPYAQTIVAGKYLSGDGVARDPAQAAEWYGRAAAQGYPDAMAGLGALYKQGEGVPQDDAKAIALFRRAAAAGNVNGQISLGRAYETGSGVPQDNVEAAFWLKLADRQFSGAPGAAEAAARLTPEQSQAVSERVTQWDAAHPSPKQLLFAQYKAGASGDAALQNVSAQLDARASTAPATANTTAARDRENWDKIIGIPEKDLKSMALRGMPQGTTAEIRYWGGETFHLLLDKPSINADPLKKDLRFEYWFTVGRDAKLEEAAVDVRGQNISGTANKNMLEISRALNIPDMRTHAIEVGAYQWAKAGFVPYASVWHQLRGQIGERLDHLLADPDVKIPAQTVEAIRSALKNDDPKSLWAVTDQDQIINGEKLGAKLLVGLSWSGKCDFSDPDSMRRFEAHTSGNPPPKWETALPVQADVKTVVAAPPVANDQSQVKPDAPLSGAPPAQQGPSAPAPAPSPAKEFNTVAAPTQAPPPPQPQPHPQPVPQPEPRAPEATEGGSLSKFIGPGKAIPAESNASAQMGAGNIAGGAVGFALSLQGLYEAHKTGDKVGMGIAGANLATSTMQLGQGALAIAGKTMPAVATGAKFVPVLNVAVTAVDGVYQISREDTTKHQLQRGAAVTTTAVAGFAIGAATEAGAGALLGSGLVAAGAATFAVAAAPAVITTVAVMGVAYVGNKAIQKVRAREAIDQKIADAGKPQKLDVKTPDGKPSVTQYKHIGTEIAKLAAEKDDYGRPVEPGIEKLDMSDPRNIAAVQRALDASIQKQQAIMKANDSMLPNWVRSGSSIDKYTDAQLEIANLTAAKAELGMYAKDLAASTQTAAPATSVAQTTPPVSLQRPQKRPAIAPKVG